MNKKQYLVIVLFIIIVVCAIFKHDASSENEISDEECVACKCDYENLNTVSNEEISLISILINEERYNTYIGLFNFMHLKEMYSTLSINVINNPTFRLDHLVKSFKKSEFVNSETDKNCDDNINGCIRILFDDFKTSVEEITGILLTADDLKENIYENYLYVSTPTDTLKEPLIVEDCKVENNKYLVSTKGLFSNQINEIIINASISDLKNL